MLQKHSKVHFTKTWVDWPVKRSSPFFLGWELTLLKGKSHRYSFCTKQPKVYKAIVAANKTVDFQPRPLTSQTSAKMISFWGAHSSESLLCWFEDFTVFSSPSLDQGASWEIPVKMHVLRQLHIPVINLGGKLTNNYTSLMHLSLCSSKVVSELKSRSKAPADSFIHLNNPPRFLGPCGLENNLLTSSAAGGLSSFSGTCLKAVRQIPFLNKKQNSP